METYQVEKVAEANFDECFYNIGDESNYFNHNDLTSQDIEQCLDNGGALKKNNGYLWGMTQNGNALWFGTAANMMSSAMGLLATKISEKTGRDVSAIDFTVDRPIIVAEVDKSHYMNGELGYFGDYRVPRIFCYDITSGQLQDKTPNDPLLSATVGLRSAGSLGNVVFLAGPCWDETLNGINLFAFNGTTREYIGSYNMKDIYDENGALLAQDINNIRKWLVVNGVLYTAVGTQTGGVLLRWTGSLASPFHFEVVGTFDDQGTELLVHENHLFVMTWPPAQDFTGVSMAFGSTNICDIIMTKNEIPAEGLTRGTEFVKVWSVDDYEPDPDVAPVYGLGAAASFDGYLYWGTMNVPLVAIINHVVNHPDTRWTLRNINKVVSNTKRTISIFRGKNFASGNPEIELLYGEETFTVYKDGEWVTVPNNMNMAPLYGPSGFGNEKNGYTWSMAVFNNDLFVGTFDAAIPERDDGIISSLNKIINVLFSRDPESTGIDLVSLFMSEDSVAGANLYRFTDSNSPAVVETDDCFGNRAAYGFRNMKVYGDALYIGTGTSFNMKEHGGWELYKMILAD